MRWSLRYQILGPVSVVMLASLATVSGWSAYVAATRTRAALDQQLRRITETLSRSNFPLTDRVLEQMKGLSGAEFVVWSEQGPVAASDPQVARGFQPPTPREPPAETDSAFALRERVTLHGQAYLHAAVPLAGGGAGRTLHVLYSAEGYRLAWQSAFYPPLVAGGGAWIGVSAVVAWIAGRFGRRLSHLIGRVRRIADGDFQPMEVPPRNDEVRDVSEAVNRMAGMLAEYHDNVRRSERLRTLEQIGAGMAHQLRNSATGCRLALDLHAQECREPASESLQVAGQQLRVMERYLARFLELGKGRHVGRRVEVDLRDVVEEVVTLAGPQARHLNVRLNWDRPAESPLILVEREELGQAVSNVLLNAIEAAAGVEAAAERRVDVSLRCASPQSVVIEIRDSGPGPAAEIGHALFEPFVTDKPDGVGLGLAVSHEIVESHRGRLAWTRVGEQTSFCIELPCENHEREAEHGDAAGRG